MLNRTLNLLSMYKNRFIYKHWMPFAGNANINLVNLKKMVGIRHNTSDEYVDKLLKSHVKQSNKFKSKNRVIIANEEAPKIIANDKALKNVNQAGLPPDKTKLEFLREKQQELRKRDKEDYDFGKVKYDRYFADPYSKYGAANITRMREIKDYRAKLGSELRGLDKATLDKGHEVNVPRYPHNYAKILYDNNFY